MPRTPRRLLVALFSTLVTASMACAAAPNDGDEALEAEEELTTTATQNDLAVMAASFEHVHAFLTRKDGFVPDTLMLRRDGGYRFETAGECGECARKVFEGKAKLTKSGAKRYLSLLGPAGARVRRFEYRLEGETLWLLFATSDWRRFERAAKGYCTTTADCDGQLDRGCRPRGLEDVATSTCDAIAHACSCGTEPLFWLPERGQGKLVEGTLLIESDGASNEVAGQGFDPAGPYACTRRDVFSKRTERVRAKAYVYWENDRLYVAPNFVPPSQEARWAPGTASFRPDGGELSLRCDGSPLEVISRFASRTGRMNACFEGETLFEVRSSPASLVIAEACTATQYTPERFWQATRPRKTTRRFTFTVDRR